MSLVRLEVKSKMVSKDLERSVQEIAQYQNIPLLHMEKINVYKIKHSGQLDLDKCLQVFGDPLLSEVVVGNKEYQFDSGTPSFVAEIEFRPGVTDNSAHSAKEALSLLEIPAEVSSGQLYFFFGTNLTQKDVEAVVKEFLANDLLNNFSVLDLKSFYQSSRFERISFPEMSASTSSEVLEISLERAPNELQKLSRDRCLALEVSELEHIRDHYRQEQEYRDQHKLPAGPTDVELEIFAQSWSEHCKHKIFSASIDFEGQSINSLYKTYIKDTTRHIEQQRGIEWLISVFNDNAGVVRFDDKLDISIKVETHNSPSALDPYGGALTGILGVNRDILGVGMGARPVANTDVFCFADPRLTRQEQQRLPLGLKHPKRILQGVHQGVEDGGNKSGIPTVNGAFYFDQDYAGKPLVFVGTVGVMPHRLPDNRSAADKKPEVGDRIFMIGGAIGRDGIHGATFSSLELSESSPTSAVQIGDPLMQKRVWDFLLEARDLGYYSAVTDNGAGGLSSSVGEMATMTGGAQVELTHCPLKYPGLKPYELFISESQERMTVAVPPQKSELFWELAQRRGVMATDIGEFNDSGRLIVTYQGKTVADLDLNFLHAKLPPMQLKASWNGPRTRPKWLHPDKRQSVEEASYREILLKLLGSLNIGSKERWVRRYDHEVQGATHLKPFGGKTGHAPGDSGVIWLYPHGGDVNNAMAIGCGLNPRVSVFDPYSMAQMAVDEAIRNVVAVGGDIDQCCLLDNFCWPDPVKSSRNSDGDYKLGQLVKCCQGLSEICRIYGTPLVSGKDSMKNDFRGKDRQGEEVVISILPTLLVTSLARVNINATVNSDFKMGGDLIYLLGNDSAGFAASELAQHYLVEGEDRLPEIFPKKNLQLYRQLHQAINEKLISSCHDVSDGGMLVAISESMIGSGLGAKITLPQNSLQQFFGESSGRFVVSVSPRNRQRFEQMVDSCCLIGEVNASFCLQVNDVIDLSGQEIFDHWNLEF